MTTPQAPATAATATSAGTAPAPYESEPGFSAGPVWGVLVLVALGAVALAASRRRLARTRRLEVLESLSLGPRRSLCLARVDGRTLVLGVSEAGVQLLEAVSPAPVHGERSRTIADPSTPLGVNGAGPVHGERSRTIPEPDGFEQLLAQSGAEQELRARLAADRSAT